MTAGRPVRPGVSGAVVVSPFGDLVVEVATTGVVGCGFRRARSAPAAERCAVLDQAVEELAEYLAGERQSFSVPVDTSGWSPFQHAVLEQCAAIPYGETRTYGELADALAAARPDGPRAVGQVLRHNPVAVIVPCHRVVGAGGALVGYGGGPATGGDLDLKRGLLAHERRVAGMTLF